MLLVDEAFWNRTEVDVVSSHARETETGHAKEFNMRMETNRSTSSAVAVGGLAPLLCAGLLYCYALNAQADAGAAWAVEALRNSDQWLFGTFGYVWGKPPGGPLTLVYASANGLNALRCMPLLFDRLLVSRLPRSGEEDPEPSSEEEDRGYPY